MKIKFRRGPIVTVIDKSIIINQEIKELIENAVKVKNIELQCAFTDRNSDGGTIYKEGF